MINEELTNKLNECYHDMILSMFMFMPFAYGEAINRFHKIKDKTIAMGYDIVVKTVSGLLERIKIL